MKKLCYVCGQNKKDFVLELNQSYTICKECFQDKDKLILFLLQKVFDHDEDIQEINNSIDDIYTEM